MFKTRGPLTSEDAPLYLERPADRDLLHLVKRTDYMALMGPRQSGKTSLILRAREHLQSVGRYHLAYVNLSRLQTLDEPRWYQYLAQTCLQTVQQKPKLDGLPADALDFRDWVLAWLEHLPAQGLLVLMLDEVEATPMAYRVAFFATLREMFVSRGVQPLLRRFAVVLAGSYVPDELIPDQAISPFRVAEKIYLEDAYDLSPLLARLQSAALRFAPDALARIWGWTEGDLYLTQRLAEHLLQQTPQGEISAKQIDSLVEKHLFEDDLFTGLEAKLRAQPRVAELIHNLLEASTHLAFSRLNRDIAHAWLLGCIKPTPSGQCTIRNPIYDHALRQIFQRLPKTRETQVTPFVSQTPKAKYAPLRGRYVLEKAIKRGLITHVYRARDLQSEQIVVVKQLLSMHGGDLIAWRRFEREGEALKRLAHPHIVTLYDVFQEGEYAYIVMEYVQGGTLEVLMNREGRQSLDLILKVMLGITDALRYTHEQGIVHRDIKPSNVLLTSDFSPRLADFGVAHFAHQGERLTAYDAIIGTPAYMPPEGYDNSHVSPTGDVWSLGVTLYELLTGALPFTGHNYEHLRHQIAHAPIPDVRQIRPDLPLGWVQVLNHMLERDPARRLPHGRAIYENLLALQANPIG